MQDGPRSWIKRHGWVLFADMLGAGLLIVLLLAATGSPAMKPALLGLLTLVPLTGLCIMPAPDRRPVPAVRPVSRRTIVITPRPRDLRG